MKNKKAVKPEKTISIFARPWFVIALVVICFAILTPKIFLPLFRQMFGYTKETKAQLGEDGGEGFMPPNLRHRGGGKMPPSQASQDSPEFSRTGPQFGRQSYTPTQSTGGSKSVLSYLLPVYAVGIGIYMIYTLFKVFNKGKLRKLSA